MILEEGIQIPKNQGYQKKEYKPRNQGYQKSEYKYPEIKDVQGKKMLYNLYDTTEKNSFETFLK